MRETPPQFEEYSVISFYPALADTANVRFGMLADSHGDGDSYTWQEGGGAYTYTVKRREEEWDYVADVPTYVWDFTSVDTNGNSLDVIVDCINGKLLDEHNKEYRPEVTNRVFRAILDATYELRAEDKHLRYFIFPNGDKTINHGFQD